MNFLEPKPTIRSDAPSLTWERRNPQLYTLTLHPQSFTLQPTPSTLHPTPYTLHLTPSILHPQPYSEAVLAGGVPPGNASNSIACW